MLDIKFIRNNVELIQKTAKQKNIKLNLRELIEFDDKRKSLTGKVEELRTQKNQVSKEIPKMSESERNAAIREMKEVGEKQTVVEEKLRKVKEQFHEIMLQVPMVVDDSTPIGFDESGNVEMEKNGELPDFEFQIKDHMSLGKALNIIDNERAVKIGGTRSYLMKGDGARLQSAVIKYAEDFISRKGYELMSVPVIVNPATLFGTGHFPGTEEETYYLQKDDKYLAGTSEVALASIHANEILNEEDLPIKLAGTSICFRREAGSYGKDTHGLYRVHQFLKVEQFVICKNDPAESKKMHEELLGNSKEFLQSLKIPFRVLNICTGDMGKGKFYMNDLESWMPSRSGFGETHSCSTLHDFQARRLNLRYKDKKGNIKFCHTLNNTVVAAPRILIPLMELNQNQDESITIPEVLRPYMGNQERIEK